MRRLRKIANIEELNNMNMPLDTLNQVLFNTGEDIICEQILYRRLMNQNTRFIVEMWKMSDNTFSVFSGNFDGMWTIDNIIYNGNFGSESEAELFIQTNLQNQAEYNEVVQVQSRLRRNDFLRKFAAGQEPDYKKMTEEFSKQINIPEVELAHETSLNRYYDEWVNYMKKYYPEWAKYPAFIWRGWGYFVDNYGKEEENDNEGKQEDVQEQNNKQDTENVEQIDIPVDFSGMDGGGGESS